MTDALVYGGIIFGGLTVVIIVVGMVMSRRKEATVSKEYGVRITKFCCHERGLGRNSWFFSNRWSRIRFTVG
jgi:hypothetical protein